jgi:hypothetical protein
MIALIQYSANAQLTRSEVVQICLPLLTDVSKIKACCVSKLLNNVYILISQQSGTYSEQSRAEMIQNLPYRYVSRYLYNDTICITIHELVLTFHFSLQSNAFQGF